MRLWCFFVWCHLRPSFFQFHKLIHRMVGAILATSDTPQECKPCTTMRQNHARDPRLAQPWISIFLYIYISKYLFTITTHALQSLSWGLSGNVYGWGFIGLPRPREVDAPLNRCSCVRTSLLRLSNPVLPVSEPMVANGEITPR
jgi:hypothetical protein